MKLKTLIIPFLFLFSTKLFASPFFYTVKDLNLDLYLGGWYEIASTKPIFQKDCVCVKANYTLKEDGLVQVENQCRRGSVDAELTNIIGTAKPAKIPGAFKVSFGGPAFFPNYLVVDLAPDYSWAVVSGPLGNTKWILARTPYLPGEVVDGILAKLTRRGFDTSNLSSTLQNGCAEDLGNIAEVAAATGKFNTLLAAVEAAGLVETLTSEGPFTVLAPTDAAFEALGQETIEALLANPDQLRQILLYHVVPGIAADSYTVKTLPEVETAAGSNIEIKLVEGRLFLNDSEVIIANIQTSNGIIHVIDKVLLP